MSRAAIAIASSALIMAGSALAQSTGPHGGLLGGKGDHKTELVVTANELSVYIIDGGKVAEAKGSTVRALVQQGGKTKTVNLASRDGKRLIGKLDAPIEKGAIVVLTGKDHHGHQMNSRYVIK